MPLQILVLSAMVFGPLSSWLAARRGRSPVAWLVLGAAAGPFAAALVALAPPGHCPRCGSRVRGWPSACSACGHVLSSALLPSPAVATAEVVAGPTEPVARRRRRRAEAAMTATAAAPAGHTTGSRPATRKPVAAEPETIRALRPRGAWSDLEVVPRPAEPTPIVAERSLDRGAEPERTLIADGVFVGGTVRLLIGGRYVIAVEGDELLILDPLAKEARSVALRRRRAGLAVTVTDDQAVLDEVGDGPAFTAAFRRVSATHGRELARLVPLVAVEVPAPTAVGGPSGAPDGPER